MKQVNWFTVSDRPNRVFVAFRSLHWIQDSTQLTIVAEFREFDEANAYIQIRNNEEGEAKK